MGIPGLYEHVEPIARVVSLHEITAIEGFVTKRGILSLVSMHGMSSYLLRTASKLSSWWIQSILHGPNICHIHKGSNAELHFAVVPLFVFDGPARPKFKRGKNVFTPRCQCREARGEAEAELAALNYQKLIDLVLTEDSDALVFGTCTLGESDHCIERICVDS
ncbi:hypothetical protein BDZ89DRAFT_1146035 [Hymenopellis radicata]|nr:hypothetical protein BDZ89DRAFT_1146035 [Hymenopellis radicata]